MKVFFSLLSTYLEREGGGGWTGLSLTFFVSIFQKGDGWKYLRVISFSIIIKRNNGFENLFKTIQSPPKCNFLVPHCWRVLIQWRKWNLIQSVGDYSHFPLNFPLSQKPSPPFPSKLPNKAKCLSHKLLFDIHSRSIWFYGKRKRGLEYKGMRKGKGD